MQAVAGLGLREANVGSMFVKEKTPQNGEKIASKFDAHIFI